ncbi:site-2 protease family protein [Actinotalea sp. AC32]|nr:site-2 protease family protein [Actinotalea sp. AC32]
MQTPRDARTRGWVVGRAAGAPVVVSPGWVLAAVVLTVLFAPTVRSIAFVDEVGAYAVSAVFVLLLLGSVFLHELAHALVARRQGVRVEELAVTLLGGHTRLGGSAPTPRASALVAASGPLVNLVLGGAAWLAAELLAPTSRGSVVWLLLVAAALANGFVGLFNLVPGLPLDGGRVLEAAVWRVTGSRSRGTAVAGWVGRAVAVLVVVWGVGRPLLAGGRPDAVGLLWTVLIGAFLWSGAGQAVRAARVDGRAARVTVRGLMRPAVAVPARGTLLDLDTAVAHAAAPVQDAVLLAGDGRPVAVVDAAAALSVPDERRARTALSAVALPLPEGAAVDVGLTGSDALRAVAALARVTPTVAVLDGVRVVGVLRSQDVVRALRAT